MKKFFILLSFLILNSSFLICSVPVHAFYPILIKKATLGNPPYSSTPLRDVDWRHNSIETDPGTVCDGQETISQTFEPKFTTVTTTDPTTGQPIQSQVAQPYDVSSIASNLLWGDKFYASIALVNMTQHIQGIIKTNFNNGPGVKRAILSMDVNSPYGNAGVNDKNTNFKQLLCYKSKRILTAISPDSQASCNEKIAWKCGSDLVPATNVNARNPGGCTKVTLEDVAAAFNPYLAPVGDYTTCGPVTTPQYGFFRPEDNCSFANSTNDPARPTPYPGNPTDLGFNPQNKAGITDSDACLLYYNAVRAASSCSLGRAITIKNNIADASSPTGTPVASPQTKVVSMPRGGIAATYQPSMNFGLPSKQIPKKYDVCAIGNNSEKTDKPNPQNIFVKIATALQTVKEVALTVSGIVKYDYKIPLTLNFDIDQAVNNDFLVKKIQIERNTVDLPASTSQDGRNIDPGIVQTRKETFNMTAPYAWQ